MKPLEDYIRSNPERFETEEPLSGHFDRFDQKLDMISGRRINGRTRYLLRIAAVAVITLMIAYAGLREFRFFNRNISRIVALGSYPELREAENFYNKQLDTYYNKLNTINFYDKAQKQQILDELSNMDKQAESIKKDLLQNPDDERVQNAMINYYQVKVEFMDMIISRANENTKTIL